jgi:hypothetical protein
MKSYRVHYTFREKAAFWDTEAESPEQALENLSKEHPQIKTVTGAELLEKPLDVNISRLERGRSNIKGIVPSEIDSRLIAYLDTVRDKIKNRVSYPREVEDAVKGRFAELNLPLPTNIRAMESGSRGSKHVMYTLSAELSFPRPLDESILPDFARISMDGHRVEISCVTFTLGLVKAGFPINKYATI